MAATTSTEAAFKPIRVQRAGGLRVALPPEQAIWLFTGTGERLWVPGWNPAVLTGDGTEPGTVFVTIQGNSKTIWIVVDFDLEALRARYARTTPGVKAGTVEVKIRSDGEDGSEVQVTYELTALSDTGNQDLIHFDEFAFATMMKEWEQHIRHAETEIANHFRGEP